MIECHVLLGGGGAPTETSQDKTSQGHKVSRHKVPGTKRPTGQSFPQTKRPTDKTSHGQNVPQIKRKTSHGQNVPQKKRPTDKTSHGQNVPRIKRKTSHGQNIPQKKRPTDKTYQGTKRCFSNTLFTMPDMDSKSSPTPLSSSVAFSHSPCLSSVCPSIAGLLSC